LLIVRRGVNLPFLTSGLQFTPPSGQQMRGAEEDQYTTTAQYLSKYHAMTSEAMVVAAKEGTLPTSSPKSL
jgi:hypothetical protein